MGINRVTVKKTDVNVRALMFALDFAPDAKVGYPAETTGTVQHADADMPMASLAAIHELGTEDIPARPFMRQGADIMAQRRGLLVPHVRRLVQGRMHGGAFMAAVGELLKTSIRGAVRRGDFTPLAPTTVAAKGSSEILVDTGDMLDALDVHLDRL